MKRPSKTLPALAALAAVAVLSSPGLARAADDAPPHLGVFAGLGYLAAPRANGTAIEAGLRLGVGAHVAASFDVGYGVLALGPEVQDRWWIMPSLALVVPAGRVRFDLGGGIGLGATSGYVSWPAYVDKPFTPVWAYQLVPAFRAHVVAATALTPKVDLFARADAAALVLPGGATITGGATTWFLFSLGAQFGLR